MQQIYTQKEFGDMNPNGKNLRREMTSALLDSENQPPVIIAKSRNWKKSD
jgi:hypothetical protein